MSVEPTSVKAIGQEVYDTIAAAIGADTISFGDSTVYLTEDVFTPSQGMSPPAVLTDGGLVAISMSGASVNVSIDPTTGDQVFKAVPPIGGWYFETVNTTNLPATVRGWAWVDDSNEVLAAALLDTPILLDAAGQSIEIDDVEFRLPAGGLQ